MAKKKKTYAQKEMSALRKRKEAAEADAVAHLHTEADFQDEAFPDPDPEMCSHEFAGFLLDCAFKRFMSRHAEDYEGIVQARDDFNLSTLNAVCGMVIKTQGERYLDIYVAMAKATYFEDAE